MCALGQPMFVNSPGLLSANWFGPTERDVATTIASLFAVVGNAVGQVMPAAMVSGGEDEGVEGMEGLLLTQAVMATLCAVGVVGWFYSTPPTPPSSSTEKRDRIRAGTEDESKIPLVGGERKVEGGMAGKI